MTQEMDWWAFERVFAADGWRVVCGVDEAGRGCLAGPVFAAAVVLPFGLEIDGLNDSKLLTPLRREALFDVITEKAVTYAVASASAAEVDAVNVLNATFLAMNRAVEKLSPQAELVLVDGNQAKGIQYLCRTIVGGDGKSASIAAASILAKVTRDRYMRRLSAEYPEYMFEQHKGYGTVLHYEMLRKYGPSSVHRQTFLKKMH
ncbi:RNase HII [Sporobacter termitidis DSM 10068]|uniref:Ribonuclease HII n=1 Tax=Sporobacter termitidis DSM 10068 TaxID=1123282 RepID=A0A1M5TL05_9FIRM|nr:ribonuclease HII [Sporobacter termitidis]SHH51356.1 RNase HII [Sporobacter termitidis DSM 10068]